MSAALAAWGVLLGVDLWQVAVREPGALTPTGAFGIAALYGVVVAVGAFVLQGVLRRSATVATAVLVAAGLACGAGESALRALSVTSPWRLWAMVGAVGVAGLVTMIGGVVVRRWPPRLRTGVLVIAIIGGAAGALGIGLPVRRAAAPVAPEVAASARPNLLLIVIDTLRADHLGCYGYARATSPRLDRLAEAGILFERAFAQSSWTKPSTASLVTGQPPGQHRVLSESSRLPEAQVTVAERLRPLGYRTALLSANPWITPEYGFDQGVDDFVSVYDERAARVPLAMQVLKRVSQATDGTMRLYNRVKYLVLGERSTTARDTLLVDEALQWLQAHGRERFFLYLHMMSPHHPYDPPPPFDRFVPDRMHPAVKNYPRKSYRLFEGGDPLDAGAFADLVARYDGDILYADTEVGRLLDGLERLGLEPSTAVLVTADHGEEFFDHGNWGHGQSVYDELVHVPLILRLPRGAAGGSRVAAPVSHADVVPTLLSLAAAPPDGRLPGRSLVPVTDVERGPPVYVLSELLYDYGDARALVYAGHKLVVRQEAQRRDVALYDLVTDPVERRPSAPDAPEIAVLTGELDRRIEAERLAQPTATDVPLDEDTRVRLRSLGYAR